MKKFFAQIAAAALCLCGCQSVINEQVESEESSFAGVQSEEESAVVSSSAPESSAAESSVPESSAAESLTPESSAAESVAPESSAAPVGDYAIDITPYIDSINSENLTLVNKQHSVDAGFVPANLADVTYTRTDRDKGKMDATAEKALCAFLEEAYHYGYTDVTVTSAYRSYASQEWYFNYYIEQEMASGKSREQAEAAVLTYSARPGTSEHQTGLCVDMHNLPAADQSFGQTEAGKWLAANAHRFGFILRFPQGKEDITGYTYEPWHFRFVGRSHAEKIYEEGLCLEEYLQRYGTEG